MTENFAHPPYTGTPAILSQHALRILCKARVLRPVQPSAAQCMRIPGPAAAASFCLPSVAARVLARVAPAPLRHITCRFLNEHDEARTGRAMNIRSARLGAQSVANNATQRCSQIPFLSRRIQACRWSSVLGPASLTSKWAPLTRSGQLGLRPDNKPSLVPWLPVDLILGWVRSFSSGSLIMSNRELKRGAFTDFLDIS